MQHGGRDEKKRLSGEMCDFRLRLRKNVLQ